MICPTQQTTQRQQLIEVATHAPCCGTQGKTRVSVEAGDPSVSEFRGFAVNRPANDGCTGMIASTAVSTCRRSVCTRWLFCPAIAKTGSPHRGETNIEALQREPSHQQLMQAGNSNASPGTKKQTTSMSADMMVKRNAEGFTLVCVGSGVLGRHLHYSLAV